MGVSAIVSVEGRRPEGEKSGPCAVEGDRAHGVTTLSGEMDPLFRAPMAPNWNGAVGRGSDKKYLQRRSGFFLPFRRGHCGFEM